MNDSFRSSSPSLSAPCNILVRMLPYYVTFLIGFLRFCPEASGCFPSLPSVRSYSLVSSWIFPIVGMQA